jgi:colanic acid/amylovoran biosynthesis glycosyltransferase
MDQRRLENFSEKSETRLCVITPYSPTVSETFIRGHLDRLPARTVLVHGWPPSIGDAPVLSWSTRVYYKLRKRLSRNGGGGETTAAYIAAFRRFSVDAVLAEYGTTGVNVMEACRKLKIPLIVHFHGYDASVYEVLAKHAEDYPRMFGQAAAVVAVSREMERKLISLGAPAEKVHYNPYGIDCRQFHGAEPQNSAPLFLVVGRFVEKKAPQLTLRAFAEVHKAAPEARLRMIGTGPLLDECRSLARDLKIDDAVTFLGAQPHIVVQEEMRRARAFVQHSVQASDGDCEGTPVGIIEACASGLPVISTRHAGIMDVVTEGQTGFLTDEHDVQGMTQNMLRLIRDPELAGRMGRTARQRIVDHFSEEQSDGRLWAIIEACLAGREGCKTDDQASPGIHGLRD